MKLATASRKKARIRLALQGPSGSGKTFSSLQVAYGLCGDWSKVAVIDTERGSAHLYSHLGAYKVVTLVAPFTPERYVEAIALCEQAGMEVIIVDSATHEWEGLLDYHSSLPGNSFTNWSKVTPRHNLFVQKLLLSSAHILATIRTKQDYVLADKNGKTVPEKVGLKAVQRDGLEYEFTLVFDLDIQNHARASKDRTCLFFGQPEQKLSAESGAAIAEWCNSGVELSVDAVSERIGDCASVDELLALYYEHPHFQQALKPEFEAQKRRLLIQQEANGLLKQLPQTSTNGSHATTS